MSSLYIVLIVLSCVYSAFLRKSTNFGIYLEISSGFEKNISNDIEEPRFRYFICNKSEDSKSEIMQLLDRSRYTIKEMYQFISSEAKRLQSFHDAHDQILDGIADMKLISGEFLNVMENNLNFIERKQKLHVERHLRLRILSEKIQTRISDLQNNPAYCTNNKVIICNLTSVFGFASGVHELLWCFINAFKEGKLVHVKTSNWHYTPGKEWVYLSFLPLAVNCVGNPTLIKKRKSPWPGINDPRVRAKINRLPKQVIKELPWLGDDPLAWWFGQIIGYLLRPDESLQHHIDLIKKDLEYRNPLVGIHIRRTDKIGLEAIHHTVDEYMNYVNHHFSRLNSFNEENTPIEGEESNKMKYRNGTVFVATDDPEAISELIEKYPMYRFIYQQNSSQIANDINARDTGLGVKTLITDLFLLASTDHIVCTMSSGFSVKNKKKNE